jgi:chromatin remodeling complex protein RSC6
MATAEMEVQTEEIPTTVEVTMDTFITKIDEMAQLNKWFQRYGKQFIRKNTRGQKRRAPPSERAIEKAKSGFAVPVTVSESLAAFLGMNSNDEIPRTEVTKRLTQYIKEHELQVEGNRKNFTIDGPLADIFNIPQGTTTNWFEMQKFLSGLLVSVKKKKNGATTAEASVTNGTNDTNSADNTDDVNSTTNASNASNASNATNTTNETTNDDDDTSNKETPKKAAADVQAMGSEFPKKKKIKRGGAM